MNAEHYHEAVGESTSMLHERVRGLTDAEARKIVEDQLNSMVKDGRAALMTDEEERLIRAFRRFKMNLRKDGQVFKWQTCRDLTSPPVVAAEDTALIRDPQEVA